MVEDIRESFIEKEVKKICNVTSDPNLEPDLVSNSSMEMNIDEIETLPVVVTQSQPQRSTRTDIGIDNGVQLYSHKSCTPDQVAERIQDINESHTTIFAPNP